jgi:two-component system response regulator QseB
MRILVVEDDEVLQEGLKVGLSMLGFVVDAVGNAGDADTAISATNYDAVVLDVGLPDLSGFDLLAKWRAVRVLLPVLVLTARSAVGDRVEGLDLGADDYLGKPFDLDEVGARLRALGRRPVTFSGTTLRWRDIEIDPNRRTVLLGGQLVPVSRREFAILHALHEHPGFVFSRTQLEDRIYGWQEEVESNAIEVHVHKLRAKLGRDVIETLRGEGYRAPNQ